MGGSRITIAAGAILVGTVLAGAGGTPPPWRSRVTSRPELTRLDEKHRETVLAVHDGHPAAAAAPT